MPKLEDEELKDNKKLLKSISGIGEKTSLLLLVATNHFKDFGHPKSVSKYFESHQECTILATKKNHDWQMQNYKGTYS